MARKGLVTDGRDGQPITITETGVHELWTDVIERIPSKGVTGINPKRREVLRRMLTLSNKLTGFKSESYGELLPKLWSRLEARRSEALKLLGGRPYYDLHKTSAKIAIMQLRKKGPDLEAELST